MARDELFFHKVDVRILKKIIDTILDRMIKELEVSSISIDEKQDFYWDIPTDALFKVKDKQPVLDIGRLSDDWDLLQDIIENPENAVSLQLIHVAPLLRWIGEKVGQ
jgi:hypothetical protein